MMARGYVQKVSAIIFIIAFSVAHFVCFRFFLQKAFQLAFKNSGRADKKHVTIYVYEIPEKLLLKDFEMSMESCPNSFYSIEIKFPELLKQSIFSLNATHTKDAALADYFLVPQYSTCYYNLCLRTSQPAECKSRTAEYMTAIVDHVENEYVFWSRKQGLDHLFVLSWDWGVHLFGEADESVIRNRLSSSIHLTLLGLPQGHRPEIFNPTKDISIPPWRNYALVRDLLKRHPAKERTIFAYFRGTITNEYDYSHGIRPRLLRYGEEDPANYFVRSGHGEFYWHELINARFALCPRGWSHWSPRLFDAIVAGAIPVIIADDWVPAFHGHFLDFSEFTIRVAEADIGNLTAILKAIPKEREETMRRLLPKVASYFIFNEPPMFGDALYSTMLVLSQRPLPREMSVVLDLGAASDGEYSQDDDHSHSSDYSEDHEEL